MTGYLLISFLLLLYAFVLLLPVILFFFAASKKEQPAKKIPFISVIVPARNEAAGIVSCLESLNEQEYQRRNYEVLIVDDHSTDDTLAIVSNFIADKPYFRLLKNDASSNGKKAAITKAVEEAHGTIIATTDADSIAGPAWLSEIAQCFSDEKTMLVCGIVAYKRTPSLFRDFLQLEQLSLQAVSAGAALAGFPLMCSGASLAYRKDFFIRVHGYENDPYVSGDDMLLLQKTKPAETRFFVSQHSLVYTDPAKNWGEAISQRGRWLSKYKSYRTGRAGLYGLLVLLVNLLPVAGLAAGLLGAGWNFLLLAFSGKTIVDLLLLSLAVPFFREPRLLFLVLPGAVFYPLLALSAAVKSFSVKIHWKGRDWEK